MKRYFKTQIKWKTIIFSMEENQQGNFNINVLALGLNWQFYGFGYDATKKGFTIAGEFLEETPIKWADLEEIDNPVPYNATTELL